MSEKLLKGKKIPGAELKIKLILSRFQTIVPAILIEICYGELSENTDLTVTLENDPGVNSSNDDSKYFVSQIHTESDTCTGKSFT
jgi:hypothetical protein